jgi:hypothetical protein
MSAKSAEDLVQMVVWGSYHMHLNFSFLHVVRCTYQYFLMDCPVVGYLSFLSNCYVHPQWRMILSKC